MSSYTVYIPTDASFQTLVGTVNMWEKFGMICVTVLICWYFYITLLFRENSHSHTPHTTSVCTDLPSTKIFFVTSLTHEITWHILQIFTASTPKKLSGSTLYYFVLIRISVLTNILSKWWCAPCNTMRLTSLPPPSVLQDFSLNSLTHEIICNILQKFTASTTQKLSGSPLH